MVCHTPLLQRPVGMSLVLRRRLVSHIVTASTVPSRKPPTPTALSKPTAPNSTPVAPPRNNTRLSTSPPPQTSSPPNPARRTTHPLGPHHSPRPGLLPHAALLNIHTHPPPVCRPPPTHHCRACPPPVSLVTPSQTPTRNAYQPSPYSLAVPQNRSLFLHPSRPCPANPPHHTARERAKRRTRIRHPTLRQQHARFLHYHARPPCPFVLGRIHYDRLNTLPHVQQNMQT